MSDTEHSDRPITIGNATKFKHVTCKLKTLTVYNEGIFIAWGIVHGTGSSVTQIKLNIHETSHKNYTA
jgi:hypothetical protein